MSPTDDIKHFLVTLDVTRCKTVVLELGTDYEAAQHAYQEAEQKARGRQDLDVVLLSADSLETIKLTHSSYFERKPFDEVLHCRVTQERQELGDERARLRGELETPQQPDVEPGL